jgi:3-hydroxyisobutyrate dehydrogenase-like beta-hydroxyacid dehydrogenase
MKIGIVGLGRLGSAIAARLIEQKHEVTVFNRTKAKTAAEAMQGDAFATILANDEALAKVVFDKDEGSLYRQSAAAIHVSMSTISPKLSKEIARAYQDKNLSFISVPVMGRPDVARQGKLVLMPAGDPQLLERCKPLFDSIAQSVHVMGAHAEQANLAKVTSNFMLSALIETFGEAFALVEKGGIERQAFYEMVASFYKSPVYEKYGKIIVDRSFDSSAFSIALQAKDTRLVADSARELECPMPFLSILEDTFLSALARGKRDLDPCALTDVIAENAGIKY